MRDFNIHLLNYESNESVAGFLDTMCTHYFLPCISTPTFLAPYNIPFFYKQSIFDPRSENYLIFSIKSP